MVTGLRSWTPTDCLSPQMDRLSRGPVSVCGHSHTVCTELGRSQLEPLCAWARAGPGVPQPPEHSVAPGLF